MLTFLSAEFLPLAAIRRYQHPTLGVLHVQTFYGKDGSADIVKLYGAIVHARCRNAMLGGEEVWLAPPHQERVGPARTGRKRRQRQRGAPAGT
jgi:hypothetical protein